MIRKTVSPIAAVLGCVAAAYVSSNLLEKHITGSSGVSWFEAGCSDDDEPGGADCAKVLASPYSYFPAKSTDPEPQNQHNHTRRVPDRTPHVPVAFLGLVYYSGLAVWFIGILITAKYTVVGTAEYAAEGPIAGLLSGPALVAVSIVNALFLVALAADGRAVWKLLPCVRRAQLVGVLACVANIALLQWGAILAHDPFFAP